MAKAGSQPKGVGIFLSIKLPPSAKMHPVYNWMRLRSAA
jgi:hypothetical protein